MRPNMMYTVLLLLCGTIAALATESEIPCGTWLINKGDMKDLAFSDADWTLRCKPVGNTPRHIMFKELRFDNVKCDERGFTGTPVESNSEERKPDTILAKSGFELFVSCAEYCASTVGVGVESKETAYNIKDVYCTDDTFDLFHNDNQINGNLARCETTGWSQMLPAKGITGPKKLLSIDHLSQSQHFECKKAPPRCTYKESSGIRFDDATKTLKCDGGGDVVWKIEYSSKVYEFIRCEKHFGTYVWKAGNDIIAEASTQLVATCIEPCSVRSAKKLVYDKNTKLATCFGVESESSIVKIRSSNTDYISLKCDMVDGWSAIWKVDKGYEKLTDPYNLRDTDCIEYCGFSGSGLTVKRKGTDEKELEITCTDSGYGIVANSKLHYSIFCKHGISNYEDQKWRSAHWTDFIHIASNTDRLDLTCQKFSRTCGLPPNVEGIVFDNDKKTLTCQESPGVAKAIQINSKLFEHLACNEVHGWAGRGSDKISIIDDTDFSRDVSCVEYCKVAGAGVKVEWEVEEAYHAYSATSSDWYAVAYYPYGYVKVTCPGSGLLYHNGNRVDKDSAICSLRDGWRTEQQSTQISGDATTPMQFECRPAPPTTTTAATTMTTTTSTTVTSAATEPSKRRPIVSKPRPIPPHDVPDESEEDENSSAIIGASIGGILMIIMNAAMH